MAFDPKAAKVAATAEAVRMRREVLTPEGRIEGEGRDLSGLAGGVVPEARGGKREVCRKMVIVAGRRPYRSTRLSRVLALTWRRSCTYISPPNPPSIDRALAYLGQSQQSTRCPR